LAFGREVSGLTPDLQRSSLGLQLCLAAVPLLIALNGLASKLGGCGGLAGW
jgi:hypothetical protein